MRHLSPPNQLSRRHRLAGSQVASALFLHSALLVDPVQSPPFL